MLSSRPDRYSSTRSGSFSGVPGSGQNVPDPAGGGHSVGRVVRAQDALPGAERDCLDHAREAHCVRRRPDGIVQGPGRNDIEPELGHSGSGPQ